jgi:sulfur carrier protein
LIIVNKEAVEYEDGMTVQDVLDKKKYTFPLITVVVNNEFVPRDSYSEYKINDKDVIEVIHIMSGG